MAIEGTARAKINLALHVTGPLSRGMHQLDSVVVFADFGDRISVERASSLSLSVCGPMATKTPQGERNLALRAARLLDSETGARITLEKHLPLAAGIGGGSADAAEVLKLLSILHGVPLPEHGKVAELGADVPVCLSGRSSRVRGFGEMITRLPAIPPLSLVLANPGVPLPTGPVFESLASTSNPPLEENMPAASRRREFIAWLARQRNDLEEPALRLLPKIGNVLEALRNCRGCRLARMSGSGATCFGVFDDVEGAKTAAAEIRTGSPEWWVVPTIA